MFPCECVTFPQAKTNINICMKLHKKTKREKRLQCGPNKADKSRFTNIACQRYQNKNTKQRKYIFLHNSKVCNKSRRRWQGKRWSCITCFVKISQRALYLDIICFLKHYKCNATTTHCHIRFATLDDCPALWHCWQSE